MLRKTILSRQDLFLHSEWLTWLLLVTTSNSLLSPPYSEGKTRSNAVSNRYFELSLMPTSVRFYSEHIEQVKGDQYGFPASFQNHTLTKIDRALTRAVYVQEGWRVLNSLNPICLAPLPVKFNYY